MPEPEDAATTAHPLQVTGLSYDDVHVASSTMSGDLSRVFSDLLMACRTGDIETVDTLLSTPNLDINSVDEYDYSPLILASLCGHTKVVQLLLSRGAVCDRDTFQGARCIYGALNDTIRDILLSFDISKTIDITQPFASHISALLSPINRLKSKDVAFNFTQVNGVLSRDLGNFRLHRFLLAARSPYFGSKLQLGGSWFAKAFIDMPTSTNPAVFKTIVDYVYLRTDSLPLDNQDIREQLVQFAEKIGATDIINTIDLIAGAESDKAKAKIRHDSSLKFADKARDDLSKFLESKIIENKIVVPLQLEETSEELDLEDIDTAVYLNELQKLQLLQCDALPDVILSAVDSNSQSVVFYPVHRSMLVRSEYFETMFESEIFTSSFPEPPTVCAEKTNGKAICDRSSMLSDHLPVIRLADNCTNSEAAELLLSFIYHDDIPVIPLGLTIELLFIADELLLDRLKTMCAVNFTSKFKEFTWEELQQTESQVGYSAYDLVRVAWSTRSDKLEQHITRMLAHNLDKVFQDPFERQQLEALIKESASRIKERHATDTIELVDDIRYYLSRKYGVQDGSEDFIPIGPQFRGGTETEEDHRIRQESLFKYDSDIVMIDTILDALDLDA